MLNFALNLEYLEAQFYSFAANGTSLPSDQLSGTGTPGAPQGGRQVTFTDPLVARYAREIAADEAAHVNFLRTALGSVAVSQPALNIDGGATGAFTAAARAAGVISADRHVRSVCLRRKLPPRRLHLRGCRRHRLQGRGRADQQQDLARSGRRASLAVEAYHAGLIRTVLYRKGMDTAEPAHQCGQDLGRARQPGRPERPRSGHQPGRATCRTSCRPTATASPSAARRARCSTSSTSTRPRRPRAGSSRAGVNGKVMTQRAPAR